MNEGGRFPFLVFLAANVKAWTFGSANGVLKPKTELGTSGSKLKEHGVLPWWWRSWSPLRGADAASSHGLFRYTDKSRNQTCVSCVSGFAGDSLPTEPLGKQSVYMNKFGKNVLNFFFFWLSDTHCPLALGNSSRYDFLLRGNMFPDTMETTSFSLQIRAGLWPALCVKQVVGFLLNHYYLGIRMQYRIYLLSKFLTVQHSVVKTKKHYAIEMTPS